MTGPKQPQNAVSQDSAGSARASSYGSGLIPFLDAWDARDVPRHLRVHLTDRVARPLVNALADFGISTCISHDLETLRLLQTDAERWPKLSEASDPALNPSAGAHDTFAIVLRRENETVGCVGMRLKRLEGTLAFQIENQSLFAERPDLLPPGQHFKVGGLANTIADVPIAWATSLWADRGVPKTMVPALMRLLHVYAYAHWFWSYSVSIAQPRVADHYGLDVHGYEIVSSYARRHAADGTKINYRVLVAGRDHIRRMVQHPGFVDLNIDLSTLDLSVSDVA
jgi:hypothetical protein